MSRRNATHAGSWYPRSERSLRSQLEAYVQDTESANHAIPGCRIIISPHAGYSYSGATAAFGFKAIDWSAIKRVFVLGPSHHFYLKGCALSRCETYGTPLGDLSIDTDTIAELARTKAFDDMDLDVDEDEHSIEMQLPYLKLVMPQSAPAPLVPILVGNLDYEGEVRYGKLLSKYLEDESNLFVISSDFCHWGTRFSYTYYHAPASTPVKRVTPATISPDSAIWQSIDRVDREGMQLIETGSHKDFSDYLSRTKNTICGRHPIGVILAAIESSHLPGHFRFLDYRQSNKVTSVSDSSVSYASGVCCPRDVTDKSHE